MYASPVVTLGIPALAAAMLGVVLTLVWRVDRARLQPLVVVTVAWLALWGLLAGLHVLARQTRPPPLLLMIVASLGAGLALGLSRAGKALATLPLPLLVGVQAFRLPLELVMGHAAKLGVMPVELSLHGYNFDIVTGSLAVVIGLVLTRTRSRLAAWLFDVVGIAALINIVALALMTSPLVHYFGTEHLNVWVAYLPFVYLPTVLVVIAVAFHVILTRRLLSRG